MRRIQNGRKNDKYTICAFKSCARRVVRESGGESAARGTCRENVRRSILIHGDSRYYTIYYT